MSIFKNFQFAERYTVQFNWTVFNVLNRTMFSYATGEINSCDQTDGGVVIPGTCGNHGFGAFASTPDVSPGLNPMLGTGAPRNMQFGLKFMF